jgi:ABC-type Na+ efflux pump permease subunit
MHVAGNGSNAHLLRWYADRIPSEPPVAAVISTPILVYRLLMLAWALWLALAILKWLRWGWKCFGTDGLWRPWRKPKEA